MMITIVLPGGNGKPSGGAKVVYEYANRLVEKGYLVSVVHGCRFRTDANTETRIRLFFRYLKCIFSRSYHPRNWMEVDRRVNVCWTPSLAEHWIEDGDIVFATSWETAEWVAGYPLEKGKKMYLIQHLEDWSGPKGRVLATWKLPLKKIVISKWLAQQAEALDEEVIYIPNGLDKEEFGIDVPIQERNPLHILGMYSEKKWKGSDIAIEAAALVRHRRPDIKMTLFGTCPRPDSIPGWIAYIENPKRSELRSIYNQASIFIASSFTEGWGLPPCEAMLCGCAVVATDIGGYREFCHDEETALIVPVGDPQAMADAIERFISNPELCRKIAMQGNDHISIFDWDKAAEKLVEAIND